jgi:hypothetical protein
MLHRGNISNLPVFLRSTSYDNLAVPDYAAVLRDVNWAKYVIFDNFIVSDDAAKKAFTECSNSGQASASRAPGLNENLAHAISVGMEGGATIDAKTKAAIANVHICYGVRQSVKGWDAIQKQHNPVHQTITRGGVSALSAHQMDLSFKNYSNRAMDQSITPSTMLINVALGM